MVMPPQYMVLLLLLMVCPIFSNLLFADQELMKTHHHERYTGDAPLTVHLIAHSHDDVGWLKTVDEYFYGASNNIQFAGVQYTIDTVITELSHNPSYKFTIVQMAFLYRWWQQASEGERQKMKNLVANGQLQFVNAGWCMSDQATMYYEDFIDQMTVGLRWLKETLNYVPDVAWHIDPFGHHSASAALFSQMGFNSFVFSRIDYQDKEARLDKKAIEMIWHPYQYDSQPSTYIFTHVNYFHYKAPPGFCFDSVCRDDPIMDDPTLQGYNIDQKAKEFVEYFQAEANHIRSSNLMHTLGQDFSYTNSKMWFKNVDKLIKYINQREQFGMKCVYSTPEDYFKAIHEEKKIYPTKVDDFFPYADHENAMWTGYFTSRTALKGFVRDFGRFIQSARKHVSQLRISGTSTTVSSNPKQLQSAIFGMQSALGILQHHDSVSGTAKQHVTDDYISTGLNSINDFIPLYKKIKSEEIKKQIGQNINAEDLYINLFWNESGSKTGLSKRLQNGERVIISFYNPGSNGTYQVKLRVPRKDLQVISKINQPITGDVICANLKDTNDCQLIFNLNFHEGSNSYVKIYTSNSGSAKLAPVKQLTVVEQIKEIKLGGNDKVKFTRGNQSFDLFLNGTTDSFKIFYNYYEGWDQDGQKSGAYIFRPKTATSKSYSTANKMYYVDGQITGMIILDGDRALTRVYFNKQADYVKYFGFLVETQLDSIPVDDNVGKEVTFNLKTNFKNEKQFYTDSMGMQAQDRKLDYRPTWNYTAYEPVAGNYYPVNAFIGMKDVGSGRAVTVVTDRSQGGSVLRQGEIELMIHRRLLVDDSRGVGEPLNQLDADGKGLRQTVRHNVVFSNAQEYRAVQMWNDRRILPTFGPSISDSFSNVNIRPAPISVPNSVKLFLRPFEDGSYLLRVHNMNPHAKATVSIDSIWKLTELTLAANQLLSEWKNKQMTWNEQKGSDNDGYSRQIRNLFENFSLNSGNQIDLRQFEIRTFKLSTN